MIERVKGERAQSRRYARPPALTRHLDPQHVTDAISALLDDPRYAHAARAAAEDLATLPGAPAAADIIEAVPA